MAFSVPKGTSALLTGPSGCGKSTLLRAIASIWPFSEGRVQIPKGDVLFIPQRSYMPLGTLANALYYPWGDKETFPNEMLAKALEDVGLGELVSELGTKSQWYQRLSLGEQQRIAFARILLSKPAVVFLDEATSALDEADEKDLYGLLAAAPWRPTVVSVGHRSTLTALHDQVLDLTSFYPDHEQVAVEKIVWQLRAEPVAEELDPAA